MNIQTILDHYIICALWSSTDNKDQPLDQNYDVSDIDSKTKEKMIGDIVKFLKDAETPLEESELDEEQIGHDFWLTRNRHGAGFWDRGLEKSLGEKLTKICHKFGEVDLYVGDDNKVHSY